MPHPVRTSPGCAGPHSGSAGACSPRAGPAPAPALLREGCPGSCDAHGGDRSGPGSVAPAVWTATALAFHTQILEKQYPTLLKIISAAARSLGSHGAGPLVSCSWRPTVPAEEWDWEGLSPSFTVMTRRLPGDCPAVPAHTPAPGGPAAPPPMASSDSLSRAGGRGVTAHSAPTVTSSQDRSPALGSSLVKRLRASCHSPLGQLPSSTDPESPPRPLLPVLSGWALRSVWSQRPPSILCRLTPSSLSSTPDPQR